MGNTDKDTKSCNESYKYTDAVKSVFTERGVYPKNPIIAANPFSKLTFSWASPIFSIGRKRQLRSDDLYSLVGDDSLKVLADRLEAAWRDECADALANNRPKSLLRAYISLSWRFQLVSVLIGLIEATFKMGQPAILSFLLKWFDEKDSSNSIGYFLAMGIMLCLTFHMLTHHIFFFRSYRLGMRLRVASITVIYRKALRLSFSSCASVTTGHVINLASNDVFRFDKATPYLGYFVIAPYEAAIALYLLWREVGVSSLAGYSYLIALIPLQAFFSRIFGSICSYTSSLTDERVRMMEQVISGIKTLKMYAWEKPFVDAVTMIRAEEVAYMFKASMLRATNLSIYFSSPVVISLLTFISYYYTGNTLDAQKVFTVITIFGYVRMSMTLCLPASIEAVSELLISIRRIETFLKKEEFQKTNRGVVITKQGDDNISSDKSALVVTDLRIAWKNQHRDASNDSCNPSYFFNATNDEGLTVVLDNISLSVEQGEIVAITGGIGSGKSTLLYSLLGEIPPIVANRGDSNDVIIRRCGSVAYVSQDAWIIAGTVRTNIILGIEYDEERYNEILEACALVNDVKSFEGGDLTEIGERGVNLSGGQKARISLARACYTNADIYLLDDPLSAVDPAVGRHIFDRCIRGFLRSKAVVLVTHQLQYLNDVTRLLLLDQGNQRAYGSHDELLKSGLGFAEIEELVRYADKKAELMLKEKHRSSLGPLYRPSLVSKNSKNEDAVSISSAKSYINDPENRLLNFGRSLQRNTNSVSSFFKRKIAGTKDNEGSQNVQPGFGRVTSRKSLIMKRSDSVFSRVSMVSRDIETDSEMQLQNGSDDLPIKFITGTIVDEGICSPMVDEGLRRTLNSYNSTRSIGATTEVNYTGKTIPRKLVTAEQSVEGSVSWRVYVDYFGYGAGVITGIIMILLFLIGQGIFVLSDWWLANWVNQEVGARKNSINIIIYGSLAAGVIIISQVRAIVYFGVTLQSSRRMHNAMFERVVRAPMEFFDSNPLGRVLNRFSQDVGITDDLLPLTFYDFFQIFFMVISTVIIVVYANYRVSIAIVPLVVAFIILRRYFIKTSRQIKRLENVARSPIYTLFSSSLNGLTSIRGFGLADNFAIAFDNSMDNHTRAFFMWLVTARWLGFRLDFMTLLFIAATVFLAVFINDKEPGTVGLSVSYVLQLTGVFQWCVRQSAETEQQMTSPERILDFVKLNSEAALITDTRPPEGWPQTGHISMRNITVSYSDDLPDVLKGITVEIEGGQKVGIVGRSGAGKSTLALALFRIIEYQGDLLIDDVPIRDIGLYDLRSQLSIIPQDPVLFSGTLRTNLDPLNDFDDWALWEALEDVQLKDFVVELPSELYTLMYEAGTNFSIGQRQLICLARAILRQNKIIIMDEATANIDITTDALIQECIRTKFKDCTVLTVAHRLSTVIDYNRILVLDDGYMAEFGEPHELLTGDGRGVFAQMVKSSGTVVEQQLKEAALKSYQNT